MFSFMPCVRCPPWARSSPSTVSPGCKRGQIDGHVGLAAGVGLDVDVLGAEELLGPVAGQVLDHVDVLAAAVVALPGIALGIFVGQHAADGLHDGGAGVVFAGDHFQPVLLAVDFAGNGGPNFRVFFGDEVHGRCRSRKKDVNPATLSAVIAESSIAVQSPSGVRWSTARDFDVYRTGVVAQTAGRIVDAQVERARSGRLRARGRVPRRLASTCQQTSARHRPLGWLPAATQRSSVIVAKRDAIGLGPPDAVFTVLCDLIAAFGAQAIFFPGFEPNSARLP